MLVKRVLVVLLLLPLGLFTIFIGQPYYAGLISLFLGLAALEYTQLFITGGYKPAGIFVVGGTVALSIGRAFNGFQSSPWILSLLVLCAMTYHLLAYERGRDQAATDFAITLAGVLYLGWLGAYMISLRDLPEGEWWVLTVLPAVWLADMGAYFVGTRFGAHRLSPRLSPKKSWEGYLAGIPFSVLGTALLALLYGIWTTPDSSITPIRGAILGLVLGTVTTLGDLGQSMIKRQVGKKDSGKLLPGHGGFFDRIDSWLWGAVIGYYLIVWLFIPG